MGVSGAKLARFGLRSANMPPFAFGCRFAAERGARFATIGCLAVLRVTFAVAARRRDLRGRVTFLLRLAI
jgi:hypothetical protein